jgi:hypothetical protein
MTTLTVQSEVTRDGLLKLEVPCGLPPGPVQVVLVVGPAEPGPGPQGQDWRRLYGLGKEVWEGVDANEYVRELREDREGSP